MTTQIDSPAPDYETWPERACAGKPITWFFPELGGKADGLAAKAKALCRRCPARQVCRDYAIPLPWLAGIWGGTTATERMRERSRARNKQQKEAD